MVYLSATCGTPINCVNYEESEVDYFGLPIHRDKSVGCGS